MTETKRPTRPSSRHSKASKASTAPRRSGGPNKAPSGESSSSKRIVRKDASGLGKVDNGEGNRSDAKKTTRKTTSSSFFERMSNAHTYSTRTVTTRKASNPKPLTRKPERQKPRSSKQGSRASSTKSKKKSSSSKSVSTNTSAKSIPSKVENKAVPQVAPSKRVSAKVIIERQYSNSSRQNSVLNSSLLGLAPTDMGEWIDDVSIVTEISAVQEMDPQFDSHYSPGEMRCLALLAHNHMKAPMRNFVLANQNLLKKFRITGSFTTMNMVKEVFGDDKNVIYGNECNSSALGGDAEIVKEMCTENLGGIVFFQDPMSSHPHTSDIQCLERQANVHNILIMTNPTSALASISTLRMALQTGRADLIPSFFETLVSPSVAEYKLAQKRVLESNIDDDNEDDDHEDDDHEDDDHEDDDHE